MICFGFCSNFVRQCCSFPRLPLPLSISQFYNIYNTYEHCATLSHLQRKVRCVREQKQRKKSTIHDEQRCTTHGERWRMAQKQNRDSANNISKCWCFCSKRFAHTIFMTYDSIISGFCFPSALQSPTSPFQCSLCSWLLSFALFALFMKILLDFFCVVVYYSHRK